MNQTYMVKRGDTLYGISNQYGVSVGDIERVNPGIMANNLKIGQSLIIPIFSGTNPDTTFTYTVKKGDSLYSIARIYNTTVNEIINLNNLKSTSLSIGQTLKIPEKYKAIDTAPNYINYTVKRGDNLYSIARQFKTTVDTIMQDNALQNSTLRIGQNLKIRTNETLEVEECFGTDYVPLNDNPNTINYTVKKGDSLYKIANNFNTSVSDIVRINNLNSNNLSIGQVLKIPNSNNTRTYTVKRGDSLYSIARAFKTTVDSIKSKNKLTSNTLRVGQVLII